MKKLVILLSIGLGFLGSTIANAGDAPNVENSKALLKVFETEAKKDPKFTGFSADRGNKLYHAKYKKDGKDVSCATCHTDDPKKEGTHPKTQKPIDGMAPALYPKRFSKPHDKIQQAFTNNCEKVLSRDCSATEKGDILSYLLSVK